MAMNKYKKIINTHKSEVAAVVVVVVGHQKDTLVCVSGLVRAPTYERRREVQIMGQQQPDR